MKYFTDIESSQDAAYAATSFGITLSRFLFAGYVGIRLIGNFQASRTLAVAAIFMLMVFDYLDGVFFSKSNVAQVKAWRVNRRVLDSIVDRLTIQMCCIPILLANGSFASLYLAITVRELVISGYLTNLYRKGYLLYPGPLAKLACVSLGLIVISFLLGFISLTFILTIAMVVLSICSAKEYFDTFRAYRRGRLRGKRMEIECIGPEVGRDSVWR
jgi:phosphatidylglycerophosphate synthase